VTRDSSRPADATPAAPGTGTDTGTGREDTPGLDSRIVDEPAFAGETERLLGLFGDGPAELTDETLAAARAEAAEPELSGVADPAVAVAEVLLPLDGRAVPVRIYRGPGGGVRPLVLWLHGGGFVGGAARDLDFPCSRLAVLGGVTVVSLDYRLAPEHPYPAGLHDTLDAVRWLRAHGAVLGGDGRLAAGGQSAGGALVAGACLLARDRGEPSVDLQVLCYPVLDFGQETESAREFDGVFLSLRPDDYSTTRYLAGQPVTEYAAPLRATTLAGLPPALVIGAGRDPLRDDARGYARRLAADGVPVTHVEYAHTMHAFLNFCPVLSAGPHALGVIADRLA
jgi:acetyl esterase